MILCKHYFPYLIQVKNLTIKSLQFCLLVVFLIELLFLEPYEHFFQKFESSLEVQGVKSKFSSNIDHNILELYNILVQVRFTTSKAKYIQYIKLGMRVGSRVAEQLKSHDLRKLGKIRKIANLGRHIAYCPVSVPEIRLQHYQLESTQKQIPNCFFVQFQWISSFCSKY